MSAKPNHALGLGRLLLYSLPALPLGALLLPLSAYLPPFYADELGLGVGAVGTIFLIARLWDVVTDPIVGAASDRTTTTWGQRRPWMVASLPLRIEHLGEVRRRVDELQRAGVQVLVLSFEAVERLVEHRQANGWRFALASDTDRSVYQRLGLTRGPWWRIWSPAVLGWYGRALFAGKRFGPLQADLSQLGGDLLVSPEGKVRWAHHSTSPIDRPSVDTILAAVSAAVSAASCALL